MRIKIFLILIFCLCSQILFASANKIDFMLNDPVINMVIKKQKLITTASFNVKSKSKKQLLETLYNFKNLQKIMKGTCEIELIKSENNSHIVKYKYSGIGWSLNSTFKRTLLNDRIAIKLIDVKTTGILPQPAEADSEGYYLVEKNDKNIYKVSYFQEASSPVKIGSSIYLKVAKSKMKVFLIKLQKSINDKGDIDVKKAEK